MKVLVIHPGDEFSTSDVFDGLCAGLRDAGHEVQESHLEDGLAIMMDAASLLSTYSQLPIPEWAKDPFGMAGTRIVAQAAWWQPELAIAVTGLKLHPSVPLTLRKMGIVTAMLCTETPYMESERQICACYDHIFTHERAALAAHWFGDHPSVHYLPHAYNPERHQPGAVEPDYACDVFFVGTAFTERKRLLQGVDWSDIRLTLKGALWHLDEASETDDPAVLFQGITANQEAARYYRSAAISLNHHRTTTIWGKEEHLLPGSAESLGPRAYEIAACGGFQLMDSARIEAREIFGDALVTYKAGDSADLERQIRYYLTHPEERQQLTAAQHAAILPHTWHARARQLLTTLS